MINKLSEQWARININIIGMFYIVSGVWEILLIMEGDRLTEYYLVGIRGQYLLALGLCTFIIGIGLLCRNNAFRLLALSLAYWNLFTAPLLEIWWVIYIIYIKKLSISSSFWLTWGETMILITLMTVIRLYIIYMLRISKAGYIFLKEHKA